MVKPLRVWRSVTKLLKEIIWLILVVIVIGVIAGGVIINPFGPSPLNKFTKDGNLTIPEVGTARVMPASR